jgi:hypothetical protein
MQKDAFVSPAKAELSVTVTHNEHPFVLILLDLGIPNFTVFSVKFPFVSREVEQMTELTNQALETLLDEVTAFMMSLGYTNDTCVLIYAAALATYSSLSLEMSGKKELDSLKDEFIKTYRGFFTVPTVFVEETQDKLVTAAKTVKRTPASRTVEFVKTPPHKNTISEAARIIRMYRNKTLKTQPRKLWVVVYDQTGRPRGTLSFEDAVRNKMRPQ